MARSSKDHKVLQADVSEVHKERTGRVIQDVNPRLLGDVGQGAVTAIPEKPIR